MIINPFEKHDFFPTRKSCIKPLAKEDVDIDTTILHHWDGERAARKRWQANRSDTPRSTTQDDTHLDGAPKTP